MRGSSVVEPETHNLQVAGSIPAPAPKFSGLLPMRLMMHTKRVMLSGLLAFALALSVIPSALAQGTETYQAGGVYAANFAYGQRQVAPLRVIGGPYAAGAATLTVDYGRTATLDGLNFNPLATNAPVLVGSGSYQETVTPTAVSCTSPAIYGTCQFTATFTYAHGTGDLVQSATAGLQEAINYAAGLGGGYVLVDRVWTSMGGTTAMITAATPYSSVFIEDNRGATSAPYWAMQPSTLTSLAVPTTLDATSVTWDSSGGTWTAAAQYLCVTYVDALGGEGPCSATYNVTPGANSILHIKSPAASTGAVGWRAYAGASYDGAYLLPISSTSCTLTTLESVMPACAIGANGTWTAIFVNTTTLRPNAQSPAVNLQTPYPQGHTTFAYAPSNSVPLPFQTHYGPFPAYGALSAGQVAVIGSLNLPTGFLNYIGRSLRIKGKLTLGSTNTATLPTLNVALGWVGGTTAGAPVNLCNFKGVAVGATKVYNGEFMCTLTTNAVGSTAVGTIQPGGFLLLQDQSLAANGLGPYVDTNTAAVATLGLFAQNTVYVTYTSTTNATNAPQLLDLHVEVLQ